MTRTETLLPVVDLSPLVMAIWSERTIWDIRGRFFTESHEQQEEVRIAVPVQEERPSTCQHVRQRLSHCSRPQKLQRCSGLTRRQLPDGQRQENSRQSGHSAATAGTGRLRSAHFWRASRSSARNEAWPPPGIAEPGTGWYATLRSQPAASSQARGGRPRRPAHRIGGRASRRCDDGHRSADVAGVDPASWRYVPGDQKLELQALRAFQTGNGLVPVPGGTGA